MVYKKIVSNMSSLSSLLLAGMVLGGSCDKGTGGHSSQVEQGQAHVAALDPAAPYVKKVREYLLNSLVNEVSRIRHKPLVMNNSDFESDQVDKVRGKQSVEALFKSFSSEEYRDAYHFDGVSDADELNKMWNILAHFTFKPSGQSGLGLKSGGSRGKFTKKRAHAKAMNEIARYFEHEHKLYEDMVAGIERNLSQTEFQNMIYAYQGERDELLQGLSSGREFLDAKKAATELFNGERMARFLSKRQAGLWSKSFNGVWVLLKNNTDASQRGMSEKKAADSLTALGTPGGYLPRRGAAIEGWAINNEEDSKMPYIEVIPHGYDVVKEFDPKKGTLVGDSVFHKKSAVTSVNLTFGQLFISTLFRGKEGPDFFSFDARIDTGTKKVRGYTFKTDSKKFQSLVKAFNEGEQAFAEYIGTHISTDRELQELFVVPDLGVISSTLDCFDGLEELQAAVRSGEMSAEVLGGLRAYLAAPTSGITGSPSAQADDAIASDYANVPPFALQVFDAALAALKGGVAEKLFGKVSSLYNASVANGFVMDDSVVGEEVFLSRSLSGMEKLAKLKDLVDGNGPHNVAPNVSYEQIICSEVAACFLSESFWRAILDGHTPQDASDQLKACIERTIKKHAIVYKEGGTFRVSQATKVLRDQVRVFLEDLAKKHQTDCICYADITKHSQELIDSFKKGQPSAEEFVVFNIDKLRTGIEEQNKTIEGYSNAMAQASWLVSSKRVIEYDTVLKDIVLDDHAREFLDRMRQECLQSVAPLQPEEKL